MRYVVLGGGIAGVCCALELARCLQGDHQPQRSPDIGVESSSGIAAPGATSNRSADADFETASCSDQVVLVSSSSVIKGVREVARLSRLVEELEVVEAPLEQLAAEAGPVLRVVLGTAVGLDLEARVLRLQDGGSLGYDKLCLCTGARPKELDVPGADHPAVMTLRDTDSVQELAKRLRECRRLVLVGNGGIALELAGALLQLQGAGDSGRSPSWTPAGLGPGPGAAGPLPAAPAAPEREGPLAQQPHGQAAAAELPLATVRQMAEGYERVPGEGAAGAPGSDAGWQPELVWVLKHGHLGDAFFDLDAAQFLLQNRLQPAAAAARPPPPPPSISGSVKGRDGDDDDGGVSPAALGSVHAAAGDDEWQRQQHRAPDAGGSGSGNGSSDRPGVRVRGHAAGPAWTRELLRGLALAQSPADAEAAALLTPQLVTAAEGCSGAVEDDGEVRRGLQLKGESAAGGVGADPAANTGAGAGGGVGCAGLEAADGGPGVRGFRLVLEFSTTVSRIEGGVNLGGAGAAGLEAAPAHIGGSRPGPGPDTAAPAWAEATVVTAAAAAAAGPREGCGRPWPLYVTLSNGTVYGADLVVCGIGVVPATEWLPQQLTRAADGGLVVGRDLRTSDPCIFAAGDCCTADWPDGSPHWFQMRLWTQARLMGTYAAHSMLGLADELASGFNFELFTHVTRFLGEKVVFLGLYNGQRLECEPEEDVRLFSKISPSADGSGNSFVRVLLLRGRMQGAVLIGQTEFEEALENIILDGLDLSEYGPHILDEDFELDHVFD